MDVLDRCCRIERSQSRWAVVLPGFQWQRQTNHQRRPDVSNGVVLSPDEKMLYIDEWAANAF